MKKIVIFLVFLLTPLTLPFLLKAIYPMLSFYKEVGPIDGWLGFLGGYVGGIIAIGGVWWQLKREDINRKSGVIKYLHYVFKRNLNYEFFDNIPYEVQSSLSLFGKIIGSKNYYYQFYDSFFYEHLKIIMELNMNLGTKLLDLKDTIEHFVTSYERFESLINRRTHLLDDLSDKIPTLKNEIRLVKYLGDLSNDLNYYLKPIKKENKNVMIRETYKKLAKIYLVETCFNDNFKRELEISMDTIFNEQSKDSSEEFCKIIINCIFEITKKAKNEFDVQELEEINLIMYNLCGKSFKINEQIKETYDLLEKYHPST